MSIAVLCCGILISFDKRYNLNHVPDTDRDQLSSLTIRDVKGSWLYLHIGMTYAITGLVCVFIWFHWVKMAQAKRAWFRSPEHSQAFYARTLSCTQVGENDQSDLGAFFVLYVSSILSHRLGIRRIFESVQLPYPTTSAHIGNSVGRLSKLIEEHNDCVQELEKVLVKCVLGYFIVC